MGFACVAIWTWQFAFCSPCTFSQRRCLHHSANTMKKHQFYKGKPSFFQRIWCFFMKFHKFFARAARVVERYAHQRHCAANAKKFLWKHLMCILTHLQKPSFFSKWAKISHIGAKPGITDVFLSMFWVLSYNGRQWFLHTHLWKVGKSMISTYYTLETVEVPLHKKENPLSPSDTCLRLCEQKIHCASVWGGEGIHFFTVVKIFTSMVWAHSKSSYSPMEIIDFVMCV